MTETKVLKKRGLVWGLLFFVVVEAIIIIANSLIQKSFRIGWSISTYVGLQTWSAVVFALSNCVVAGLLAQYLWKLGRAWSMPRLYYYCCFLAIVGLIWLSFCPVGYFDVGGQTSIISFAHQIASRLMFIMMLLVAVMLAGRSKSTPRSQAALAVFVVYAFVCVAGYMTEAVWFMPVIMVYETLYIVGFVSALIISE